MHIIKMKINDFFNYNNDIYKKTWKNYRINADIMGNILLAHCDKYFKTYKNEDVFNH